MAIIGPFNFRGGYCPGYDLATYPQNKGYASLMMGCRVKGSSVIPRYAQHRVNSSTFGGSKYVKGLAVWFDVVNSKTAMIAVCNTVIEIADATTFFDGTQLSFTDRTGAVTINAADTVRYTFDSLNGMLIGTGNSAAGGVPFKVTAYNANAAVLGGSPPNGDIVKQVNNYLFIGRQMGSTSTYSTVSWSNVVDPETWTAGNSVEFNKKDGESVTALGSIGTDLYIFKPNSIGRLSTYSQSVAGSTTLGPLQILFRGIGCCGPLAIDNLPDGRIVFMGSNGHLYIFDGSVLEDVSVYPYPAGNVFDSREGFVISGMTSGIPDTFTALKVFPGLGEIWISFENTYNDQFSTWVYDYVQKIWQGGIMQCYAKCFATLYSNQLAVLNPSFVNSNQFLFSGNEHGYILQQNYLSLQYPSDEAGITNQIQIGTFIHLGNDSTDFIPRSIIFEQPTASSDIHEYVFYYGWNTDFSSGTEITGYSSTAAQSFNTPVYLDYPNTKPRVLSLRWTLKGPSSSYIPLWRFGNFYLSDEIIQ